MKEENQNSQAAAAKKKDENDLLLARVVDDEEEWVRRVKKILQINLISLNGFFLYPWKFFHWSPSITYAGCVSGKTVKSAKWVFTNWKTVGWRSSYINLKFLSFFCHFSYIHFLVPQQTIASKISKIKYLRMNENELNFLFEIDLFFFILIRPHHM